MLVRILILWVGIAVTLAGESTRGPSRVGMAPMLHDVEAAFARIQVRGDHLSARSNGWIAAPAYRASLRNGLGLRNHFQGIQPVGHSGYLILSGANPRQGSGDLMVIRMAPGSREGTVVTRLQVDRGMWHAGGVTALGDILAVALHGSSPRNGRIAFYDVGDPENPRRLAISIERPGRKASSTALTQLANGRFLVAVLSAWDGLPRRMDLYLSRTTRFEDGFVPAPVSWHVGDVRARAGQQQTFSFFQGISFVRQVDGKLYLIGFHNSFSVPAALPGRDYADLYEVTFPPGTPDDSSPAFPAPTVTKVGSRRLICTDGYCNLDAAAGLMVDEAAQTLSVYATPGWLAGDLIKLTLYRGTYSRP